MKILRVQVTNKGLSKEFIFSDKTLIHSTQNSVGKSTLLRLLFFGLGYPIPGTYGFQFQKTKVAVFFERDGHSFQTIRPESMDNYIELYRDGVFWASDHLSSDNAQWLALIWGIESENVLNNILGAIYMDQDKGWTLLNRGKVIGNIRFNVRDLLVGLGDNKDGLEEDLARVSQQKKIQARIRQLIALKESSAEFEDSIEGHIKDSKDIELEATLKNLRMERRVVQRRLSELQETLDEQSGLKEFITSLNLSINTHDEEVLVTKNNIAHFSDNLAYLKHSFSANREKRNRIDVQMTHIKDQLKENATNLFTEPDVISRTMNVISNLQLDATTLSIRDEELRDSIELLNENIEKKFMHDNSLIDTARGWINTFAERLNVFDQVKDKKYIFTRDLKSISGTIYYKIVFAFKMAYIKTIEETIHISLPIVLDSPSGREVTDINISEVIDILNEYFESNQIIIASINKFNLNDVKEINLKGRLLN